MRYATVRVGLLICAWLVVTTWLWADAARARSSGAPAGSTGSIASGGETCAISACHGATSLGFDGFVEVVGVPSTYVPGELYDLAVRISDPAQQSGGFQLSIEDRFGVHAGQIIVSEPARTQLVDLVWLTHTSAGIDAATAGWLANGGSAAFRLQWQAPTGDLGPLTFWAAGNAVDNSNNNRGDHVYLSQETIPLVGTALGPCGDIDADGDVDPDDIEAFRSFLADPLGSALPGGAEDRCSVIDPPGFCDVLDVVVMRRVVEGGGAPPGIQPVCQAASETATAP